MTQRESKPKGNPNGEKKHQRTVSEARAHRQAHDHGTGPTPRADRQAEQHQPAAAAAGADPGGLVMNESEIRALLASPVFQAHIRVMIADEAAKVPTAPKPERALRALDSDPAWLNTFRSRIADTLTDRSREALADLRDSGFFAVPSMFTAEEVERFATRLHSRDLGPHLPIAAWSALVAQADEARQAEAVRLFRRRTEATQRAQAESDAEAKAFARKEAARAAQNQGGQP